MPERHAAPARCHPFPCRRGCESIRETGLFSRILPYKPLILPSPDAQDFAKFRILSQPRRRGNQVHPLRFFRLGVTSPSRTSLARNRTLVHTPVKGVPEFRRGCTSTAAPKFGYPLCNYPSEIDSGRLKGDTDARMFGGEHKVRPYAPPNVGANLVFVLIPKSCGSPR
ncbi:MAG: hypothetical protein BECKG1743F_GA0114225_112041 [Candidatus Kentron sp. G]|nr:MAG: hypothetical protein BECKG1743F_GA0114225_112041 [Candidatus Kentron sp. G]